MVAYDCNPNYVPGIGRRIMVQGQPQAKTQDKSICLACLQTSVLKKKNGIAGLKYLTFSTIDKLFSKLATSFYDPTKSVYGF
jgi:hypothetical protein